VGGLERSFGDRRSLAGEMLVVEHMRLLGRLAVNLSTIGRSPPPRNWTPRSPSSSRSSSAETTSTGPHSVVKDGFMNRFLIADADPKEKSNDLEDDIPVPLDIIDRLRRVATFGDSKLAPVADDNRPDSIWNKPRRVGWTDYAKEAFYAFRDEIEALADVTPVAPELLARVPEQTQKLATIRAVSWLGPEEATVDYWDLEWGAAWAIESAKSMIESVSTMMAANPYEKNLNRVRTYLRDKGGFVTQAELLRKFRDIPARDLAELTDRMIKSGEVEPAEKETSSRPAKGYRKKA
jgi:hypothetical protein